MLFDIEKLLKNSKLSDKQKENLLKELREEFPQDEMLFELHLIRAIEYYNKQKSI